MTSFRPLAMRGIGYPPVCAVCGQQRPASEMLVISADGSTDLRAECRSCHRCDVREFHAEVRDGRTSWVSPALGAP